MNEQITTPEEFINEPWSVNLTPTAFARTKEKIDKLNARAIKRGFTGRVELTGERFVLTHKNRLGIIIEEVFYKTTITGDAPCYNGWRFIARIDVLPDGETFTIATAPSVGHIDRSLVKVGVCEHCNSYRRRKNLYLVENVETGEIKNVGSGCIKDFLGHVATFVSVKEISDDLDDEFGGQRRYEEETYTLKTILAVAYIAIREFGWCGAAEAREDDGKVATKAHIMTLIDPPRRDRKETWKEKEYLDKCEELAKHIDEAFDRVPDLLDWVNSLGTGSTFNENLKAACSVDEVTRKQIGILAYVPEGFARLTRKAAEREAIAKTPSEFIGKVGERIEISGTIKAINYFDGQYGVTTLYTIVTEQGLVKWFSSSAALGEDTGVDVKLRGTVKKHDTFKEVKSTVLTRCTSIA